MARIDSTWDHQVGLPTIVRHTKITNIPRSAAMRHWCNVVFWVRTIFWWFRNWFFDHIYFTDDTSMTATTSLHKNQRIVETLGTFWFSGDDPDTHRKHCGKHVYCCGYNRIDMGPGHSQVTINSSYCFGYVISSHAYLKQIFCCTSITIEYDSRLLFGTKLWPKPIASNASNEQTDFSDLLKKKNDTNTMTHPSAKYSIRDSRLNSLSCQKAH